MRLLAIITSFLLLAACASLGAPPPAPGEPVAAVVARLGQPDAVHALPDGGQRLEYSLQPLGQYAWMATFGPDGRLRAWEQVLDGGTFATILPDRTTKPEVLRTLGHPAEVSTLPLRDLEVWSYRYKEAGVWNSMMHVHFDRQGVVRQMLNGPDPMYDERFRRW